VGVSEKEQIIESPIINGILSNNMMDFRKSDRIAVHYGPERINCLFREAIDFFIGCDSRMDSFGIDRSRMLK